jgi:hypothetical protein
MLGTLLCEIDFTIELIIVSNYYIGTIELTLV